MRTTQSPNLAAVTSSLYALQLSTGAGGLATVQTASPEAEAGPALAPGVDGVGGAVAAVFVAAEVTASSTSAWSCAIRLAPVLCRPPRGWRRWAG